MFQQLGIALTAWKIGARRFGPVGGAVFAAVAVAGVAYLRDYLRKEHPEAERHLDTAL